MKFAPLAPHNYPAIARTERARRRQAAARAGWDQARRAADDADWAAIEEYDFHLVEIRAADDRPDTPSRDMALRLAAVAEKVAATAIRKWHADGRQTGGEAEARAFKLLNLARRMARCTGTPTLAFGEILALQPERTAA
jgi:hypothetical protein